MKDKKSFVLYADLTHTVSKMPTKQKAELFQTILDYVNDLDPDPKDIVVQIAFEPIKQQLKRDLLKWSGIREKRSDAGKKSAEKRAQQKSTNPTSVESVQQTSTNPTVTVNDTVNVNETKERFSAFWDLYNKKVSRSSCERIWNKLKESDRDAILYTLPSFLETITDKQYQPHPKTYLNQRRWEDVIDKSDGKPPQMKQENWDKLDSWQQESIRAGIAL